MHIEPRLLVFTRGVRTRIAATVAVGLLGVGLGIARLALLGWLIGQVFTGKPLQELVLPVVLIAVVMVLRGAAEHWRAVMAHETAARVQKALRRTLYDKVASLGPATVGRQRSGGLTLSMIDGVEQLETYFGQFLPQFMIALLSPLLIFMVVAFIDLPVAAVMLGFALLALFAPALWHKWDVRASIARMTAYKSFAAEFLDSIQGLATLKAFGQGKARADKLEVEARDLFRRTMWVLGTNSLARGITDTSIAGGAAAALIYGASRVESGAMSLTALLVILMLGVEIFRPMRELRSVLHQGMVGLSAAQGIYRILDDRTSVADAPPATLSTVLAPTIVFENVRFAYPGTRRTVHDNLNFTAAAGERLGLVGSSGGGKSSIVRLLLRFYDPDQGRILLGGHDLRSLSFAQIRSLISVVNQDTFLFHGTVEENVRLGKPGASQAEMEDAARAANIHEFILSLPQGYQTVIGEKGIKLSGGQRQRLAIARALLRDTPILVLDEALSAVDAENEAVIQEALDRLMQGRTTLILAHRLSSVIDCDRILVLDRGHVAEEGKHGPLMSQGGVYARLMAEQAREQQITAAADVIDVPARAETAANTPGGAAKPVTEGIIKAEGLTWYQVVAALMKVIMPWKGKLTATFVLGVLRVVAFIGIGVLSALIVLALKNHEPYGGLAIALAVLAPLSGLLHWLESWLAHDMAFRLLAEMRIDAFRKLDALAPAYLTRRRTGDLMALATHDIELVEYFFAHTVAPAFVAILVPAVVVAALATANGWLAVALVPFLLAVGLSPFLMRKRVDRLGSQAREAAGELGAFAVDSVQGLGEIVAFQQEKLRGDKLDQLSQRHISLRLPFFSELTLQHAILEVLTGLGGLAVVVVGAVLSAQGALDPGLLPLMTILAMAAFLPVSEIAQIGRQLADTLGATRRVYALANEPIPVRDGPGVPVTRGAAALSLEKVTFTYPGQTRRALNDVSFDIPAGKTVALVGRTGSGKSTVLSLLPRVFDPPPGTVFLDGVDVREWNLDALRAQIAPAPQETFLFSATVAENIAYGAHDATPEAVQAAARLANLDGDVQGFPAGYETRVGERGITLSGGQRQRAAIARAVLREAPVLLLDDCLSAVDTQTEEAILQGLRAEMRRRTCLLVSHRVSAVREADEILVFDRGRIAERGRHDELLALDGRYAALHRAQQLEEEIEAS